MSELIHQQEFPGRMSGHRHEGVLHTILFSHKAATPVLLFVIAFLLYANTIGHDFAIDDKAVIEKNVFVQKGIAGLVDIFSTGSLVGYNRQNDSYRPLPLATYAGEISLAGNNPHVHHLTNVILYCFIAVALFVFLKTILKNHNPIVPFIISLLFVVHPVHTEAVANIKGRDELLSFLFMICAIILLFRGLSANKAWFRILSGLSYFLALLSKEHVIMFLFMIPLIMHFFTGLKWRQIIRETLPFIIGAFIYLSLRWSIIDSESFKEVPPLMDNSLAAAAGLAARIPMAFNILGRYLLLLFFPVHLSYDYSYNQIPFVGCGDVWSSISIAVYTVLFVYAIYGVARRDVRSFGIAFYLSTLFIVSNIPFLIGSTMAERLLFTPSLGFCYTLGLVAARYGHWESNTPSDQQKGWIVLAAFFISIILGIRTINRGADWKNNLTLLTSDVISSPKSARVQSALGETYMMMGKGLRRGYQQTEVLQRASVYYRKALEILPAQWDAWHGLGYTYYLAGDYNEALKNFQNALHYESNSALVHLSLGETYMMLGKNLQNGGQRKAMLQKAIVHYRKSIEIIPSRWNVWQGLGYTYYLSGDDDEALKYFQRALEYDANKSITYVNMGQIAFSRKEYDRAIELLKIAVKRDSLNANAFGNLGAVYYQIGEYKNALACDEKALQLDAGLENVRRNLELLKNAAKSKK
jgi:protein O-mannosyl-transferase